MADSNKPNNAKKSPLTSSRRASAGSSNSSGASPASSATHASDRVDVESAGYRERVYEIVRRIPAGRVMTYGQIAEILGEGYTPRTIGFVMHAADEDRDPWHRVINSQGACSTGRVLLPSNKQQRMLEAEGVVFDARARCDLGRYRWSPDEVEGAGAKDKPEDDAQPSLFDD